MTLQIALLIVAYLAVAVVVASVTLDADDDATNHMLAMFISLTWPFWVLVRIVFHAGLWLRRKWGR